MNNWFHGSVASNAASGSQRFAASLSQVVYSGAAVVSEAVRTHERHGAASDRQHVRLPVESARRLRWFENRDVNNVVREHAMEKQQLMACVAAMRTCMVQRGVQVVLDMDFLSRTT
jgi:hypothetical protein